MWLKVTLPADHLSLPTRPTVCPVLPDAIFPCFAGEMCELVDHCASQPCKNGASCVSSEDGYSCICADGFRGWTCTVDIDECRESSNQGISVCQNGGRCRNIFGGYRWATTEGGWGHTKTVLMILSEYFHQAIWFLCSLTDLMIFTWHLSTTPPTWHSSTLEIFALFCTFYYSL